LADLSGNQAGEATKPDSSRQETACQSDAAQGRAASKASWVVARAKIVPLAIPLLPPLPQSINPSQFKFLGHVRLLFGLTFSLRVEPKRLVVFKNQEKG
jgi:hypothetical protein